jgi:hypothetical protein
MAGFGRSRFDPRTPLGQVTCRRERVVMPLAVEPGAASSRWGAPMLSTLLATKLYRPHPTQYLVARPRLTLRIDQGLRNGHRLFLVVPPGLWLPAVPPKR